MVAVEIDENGHVDRDPDYERKTERSRKGWLLHY